MAVSGSYPLAGYRRGVSPFPTRAEQGIPALGAVLLLACTVYIAALGDVLLTGSLGWGLGAVLIVGSAVAAARVARRDLAFAVVAPPLAFAAGTFAAVPFTAAAHEESFPLGTALAFAGALGGGAPLLGAGVLCAGVLALVRWELGRRAAVPDVVAGTVDDIREDVDQREAARGDEAESAPSGEGTPPRKPEAPGDQEAPVDDVPGTPVGAFSDTPALDDEETCSERAGVGDEEPQAKSA